MNGNKKATGDGVPQAALNIFFGCHSNPIIKRLKVVVYRLAPWLFFLGVLHG
jgi:hypothetical protein